MDVKAEEVEMLPHTLTRIFYPAVQAIKLCPAGGTHVIVVGFRGAKDPIALTYGLNGIAAEAS